MHDGCPLFLLLSFLGISETRAQVEEPPLPSWCPTQVTLTATPSATFVCTQTRLTLTATEWFGCSYEFTGPGIVSTFRNTAVVDKPGVYKVYVKFVESPFTEYLTRCVGFAEITVANGPGAPAVVSIKRKTPAGGGAYQCHHRNLRGGVLRQCYRGRCNRF